MTPHEIVKQMIQDVVGVGASAASLAHDLERAFAGFASLLEFQMGGFNPAPARLYFIEGTPPPPYCPDPNAYHWQRDGDYEVYRAFVDALD